MFKNQGEYANDALNSLLEIAGEIRLFVQDDISDDGYWGIDQTAERILDFAKALSGGDPSRIAELRKAVENGFETAEKALGGNLPDISDNTRQKIMDGFDKLENTVSS